MFQSSRYLYSAGCLVLAAGLWIWAGCGGAPESKKSGMLFTGLIVDAESGEKVAATVHLTGPEGETLSPGGEPEHVDYLGKTWYYQDGAFEVPDAPDLMTVEIRRGPEYLPLRETVDLRAGTTQTFRVSRWIHMLEQGWLSGDTHIHYLSQASTQMRQRAEDLRIGNLLVSDFTNDREKFIGKLDPVSDGQYLLYVSQEFRDWDLGHINLLRLKTIVEPFEPFGGAFQNKDYGVNHFLARAARKARSQGGVVTFAHFSNLPGFESPIMVVNRDLDALDLSTYDDPRGPVTHIRPWLEEYSGLTQAEFPRKTGLELWYTMLNAGLDIPIADGTDRMNEDIPIGSIRYYVRFSGRWNFDTWVDGIKEGSGFMTNGPMLSFQVENWSPGHREQLPSTRPRQFFTRVTAGSVLPFDRLEIVQNGGVIAASDKPQPDADGVYRAHLAITMDVAASSWVAARAVSNRDSSNMILPRHHTVFAHTNPIYIELGGQPVQDDAARRYLATWIRGALHFADTRARFKNPGELDEFRLLARQALLKLGALTEEAIQDSPGTDRDDSPRN